MKCVFVGSYFSSAFFGQGIFPIMMDYVNCSGSEFRLWDCHHFTHSYGCTHSDDVGVRCQPGLSFQLHVAIPFYQSAWNQVQYSQENEKFVNCGRECRDYIKGIHTSPGCRLHANRWVSWRKCAYVMSDSIFFFL